MTRLGSTISAAIALAIIAALSASPNAQGTSLPVFPGAQGFGTMTPAGSGRHLATPATTVYRVTNLNDSGTGSLRAALTASGPRTVVFETSGKIVLTSAVIITSPYLTVAGQTAPSPGITVEARQSIRIETSHVLFQHFRVRRGDATCSGDWDTLWIRNNAHHVVLDHMSLSWGVDGTLDVNAGSGPEPYDIAVLDSIISEGLAQSCQSVSHSRAMLLRDSPTGTATIARNLYAHSNERHPAVAGGWRAAVVNNVQYNYYPLTGRHGPANFINGSASAYDSNYTMHIAYVGNVAIAGPDTPASTYAVRTQNLYPGSSVYLRDNSGFGVTGPTGSGQWAGVNVTGLLTSAANYRTDTQPSWYSALSFAEISGAATGVRDYVLSNAGARPADRDAVDTRVVSDVRLGTGHIIDSPSQVGGFPALAVKSRALTLPANPNALAASGYTNLEVWLHSMKTAVEGAQALTVRPPAAPSNVRVVE
jgi:hypothetical protein